MNKHQQGEKVAMLKELKQTKMFNELRGGSAISRGLKVLSHYCDREWSLLSIFKHKCFF